MSDGQTVLLVLAGLLIIGGFIGTFLPLLPGVAMMFAGMALVGWLSDFQRIGYGTLAVLFTLTVLAHVVDYVATAMGAQKMGASRYAIWGAVLGSVIGIAMGMVGVLFMPFLGAVIGELITHWNLEQATKVGIGTWLGLIIGMALKIAIAFIMLGIFGLCYFW